jgi:flagellar biosynthesis protein
MKNMENELKKAIALTYKEGQYAPQVVAKGRGVTAEAIIACAREAGIYVHEAPELVSLLMQVDVDQHIPPELYLVVAELLAWIYWLENRDEHLRKPAW